MFFSFDWQVELIISYLEDFTHRLTFFEPRHYGGVFVYNKNGHSSQNMPISCFQPFRSLYEIFRIHSKNITLNDNNTILKRTS